MSKLNIIQTPCKKFKYYGTPRSGKLDSIQVHSIGTPQNTGMNIVNNMNQNSPSGITHYVIDAEKELTVYQLLPDTNTCWADAGYGNRRAITFEISESDSMRYTGGASFTITNKDKFMADLKRGYKTAVIFVAEKCEQYGWDPQEKLPDGRYRVWSHREGHTLGFSSNHGDPDHFWSKAGYTMDKFRADVKAEMEANAKFKVNEKYVLKSDLYIRRIPGGSAIKFTDAPISTQKKSKNALGKCKLKKGTVITCRGIKETQNGNIWIKHKAGWIAGYYKKEDKVKKYTDEFIVKITSKKIEIHKNPSQISDLVGYTGKGKFTIIKEKNGWGLLKSKTGWIYLGSKKIKRV